VLDGCWEPERGERARTVLGAASGLTAAGAKAPILVLAWAAESYPMITSSGRNVERCNDLFAPNTESLLMSSLWYVGEFTHGNTEVTNKSLQ
jgi:hypothetical protein